MAKTSSTLNSVVDAGFRTTIEEIKTGKKGVAIKFGQLRELGGKSALLKAAEEQLDMIVSIQIVQPDPELFDGEKA